MEGELKTRSGDKAEGFKGKHEVTSWLVEAESSTIESNCRPLRQNIRPLSQEEKVSHPRFLAVEAKPSTSESSCLSAIEEKYLTGSDH